MSGQLLASNGLLYPTTAEARGLHHLWPGRPSFEGFAEHFVTVFDLVRSALVEAGEGRCGGFEFIEFIHNTQSTW